MPESQFIPHRGCPLAYRVRGKGPPVLFIQGTGLHGDGWLPQVEVLSRRFRCATFDNRGIGRSKPQGASVTIAQMADDAVAVMDALGWAKAHVVGHSLGGLVAQAVALNARSRVRSLALLCTFSRGLDAAGPTPWKMWVSLRSQIGTLRARRRSFLRMILTRPELATLDLDALAEKLAPLFGHDLAKQPPVVLKQLRAMDECDLTPRLGELAGVPTVVVTADSDRLAPVASGRAIATGIPGARYIELANAAHGVPLIAPQRINELLAEHFGRLKT